MFITDCGQVPQVQNGSVSFSSTNFPSSAEYSCAHGYVLHGNKNISCQSNGTWSESTTTCVPVGK